MLTTKEEIVRRFCETQQAEPPDVMRRLAEQEAKYEPEGFMLLENQMFDSSRLGHRYILPFGKRNSMKSVPTGPFSMDGLASGTVVVVATYLCPPVASVESQDAAS
jgi:hypothetical protein